MSNRGSPELPVLALKYPVARKVDVVDDYGNVKVPDPYRWIQGSHNYRPTDKLIEERADQWAFAARHTGLP